MRRISEVGLPYAPSHQSTRHVDLADLFTLPDLEEGITPCQALILTTDHGKMNQYGRMEYAGALRHKDSVICSLGALLEMGIQWRTISQLLLAQSRLVSSEAIPSCCDAYWPESGCVAHGAGGGDTVS
jgi:centromere DNA-binding complex CBF3 subunit-like protein